MFFVHLARYERAKCYENNSRARGESLIHVGQEIGPINRTASAAAFSNGN